MKSNWLVEYWKIPKRPVGSHAQMSEQLKYIKPEQENILRRYFTDYKSANDFAASIFARGDYHTNVKQGQTLKPELNLEDARKLLEEQFRVRLYKDPKYPFIPAMGTRHMFQGFDTGEDGGYIGTLHLWWSNDSGEPSYHTKDKQFISGYWKSEWIDDPKDAIQLAIECERKQNIYAEQLTEAFLKYESERSEKRARELLDKRYEKDMKKMEEESKKVLWN